MQATDEETRENVAMEGGQVRHGGGSDSNNRGGKGKHDRGFASMPKEKREETPRKVESTD